MHEVVAHLVAGAVALAEQAEAYLEGKPIPPFGSWEERDSSFRAINSSELYLLFDSTEERMTRAFDAISAVDPYTVIPEGGWGLNVHHLALHMRQEYAIHRWDFIGDDALGDELLALPELLEHSVSKLDQWLLARGLQNSDTSVASRDEQTGSPSELPFRAWIRSEGEPDLMIETSNGTGRMQFTSFTGNEGFVEADPAARLLMIWGRHPQTANRIRSTLPMESLVRLTGLLLGF